MIITISVLNLLVYLPVIALFTQVTASFFHKERNKLNETGLARTMIVIPAHNEEKVIARTLTGYLKNLPQNVEVIVVADNCSDQTVQISKQHAVTVIERFDNVHRGKGYAMQFAIEYIKKQSHQPDFVIFLDADSFLMSGSISEIIGIAVERCVTFQIGNMIFHEEDASVAGRLKTFAWLMKNFIRPIGAQVLGFNCLLQGNGMIFPWGVLKEIDVANSNIVEDNKLAVDLTEAGYRIEFYPDVVVGSYFEPSEKAVTTQVRRWEGGSLVLIFTEIPRLVKNFVKSGRVLYLGAILNIIVPPISLTMILVAAVSLLGILLGYFLSNSNIIFLSVGLIFIFAISVLLAWFRWGRSYLYFSDFGYAFIYAFKKIPFYISLIFRRVVAWERAGR